MKLKSHSLIWSDFRSKWYRRWAQELLQDESRRENFALFSNKFWQNAVMAQALWERSLMRPGIKGIGFGVGQERLPALFAKYGVKVMATDQDFTTRKAKHWSKHELASGTQSLNRLGICNPAVFEKNVSYMPVDMNAVSSQLYNSYDFAWSNCALGHLGSIEAGLRFIEQSLHCLVPGGWAVHTTELNILSNEETVSSGNTVLFRLKDILGLQQRLVEEGFVVIPFTLQLGAEPIDRKVALNPQFGNDYSKIQFAGHLATQIVLILHKPKRFQPPKEAIKTMRLARLQRIYTNNLKLVEQYRTTDKTLELFRKSKDATLEAIRVSPFKTKIQVRIDKGKAKKIKLNFRNESKIALFSLYSNLSALPIVLATAEPVNRESKFYDSNWLSANRLSIAFYRKDTGEKMEFLQPAQDFYYECVFNTSSLRRGRYKEAVCIVQEGIGLVPESTIHMEIEVT